MHPIEKQVKEILAKPEEEHLIALEALAKEYGWSPTVRAVFTRYAVLKYPQVEIK